jgi:hypothetical protein
MKIGATSVPALNTIHLQSFGQANGPVSSKTGPMRGEAGRSESFTYGRTFPPLQLVNLGEFCGSEGSSDRESISPALNPQRDAVSNSLIFKVCMNTLERSHTKEK